MLYSIVFLHQTTTGYDPWKSQEGCILLFSYIKPQPDTMIPKPSRRCILLFSYIKPQHFTINIAKGCVVFYCFPTSNHNWIETIADIRGLYSIVFLHQTTTLKRFIRLLFSCILLFSYIKPQRSLCAEKSLSVVFYCFPTSNHNCHHDYNKNSEVVFYCFPTSNHNCHTYP